MTTQTAPVQRGQAATSVTVRLDRADAAIGRGAEFSGMCVPVFWDITTGLDKDFDHVAISVGGGWCVSTSAGPNRTVASVSIAALDGTVASTGPPDHLGAHVGVSAGLYAYPPDGWRGPMTIGAEIRDLNVQRAYLLTRSAPGGA